MNWFQLISLFHLYFASVHGLSDKSVPDFFVIGAQKAGTSSLNDLLWHHPNVCYTVKEKHFFDVNNNFQKGYSAYAKMYDVCPQNKFVIDGTPMFQNNYVPGRLATTYSNAVLKQKKFILLLREPVSREFSLYEHKLRECDKLINRRRQVGAGIAFAEISCHDVIKDFEHNRKVFNPMSFREYYMSEKLVASASNYVLHLNNWLNHIDRRQIFIINMETLLVNTSSTMFRLSKFLNFSTSWGENVTLPHDNDSSHVNAVLDCETYDQLHAYYQHVHKNLYELIRHGMRPQAEPPFFPFSSTREKCKDLKARPTNPSGNKDLKTRPANITDGKSLRGNTQQRVVRPSNLTVAAPIVAPHALLMGVEWGGQEVLARLLNLHSGICVAEAPRHTLQTGEQGLGKTWPGKVYNKLFDGCNASAIRVDSTPVFRHGWASKQLAAAFSRSQVAALKIVLVLREPVARDIAAYDHKAYRCFQHAAYGELYDKGGLKATSSDKGGLDSSSSDSEVPETTTAAEAATVSNSGSTSPSSLSSSSLLPPSDSTLPTVSTASAVPSHDSQSHDSHVDVRFLAETSTTVRQHCADVLPSEAHVANVTTSLHQFLAMPFSAAHPVLASLGAAGAHTAEGYYKEQLDAWLRVVARSQVMILNFETLVKNTTATLERIRTFLRLPVGWDDKQDDVAEIMDEAHHQWQLRWPPVYDGEQQQQVENLAAEIGKEADGLTVSCNFTEALAVRYRQRNRGLRAIVDDPKRPAAEPPFPYFHQSPVLGRCTNATSNA